MRFRTVILDADSTLADIEGIDWLAERRDAAVHAEVARITALAMSGEATLDAMYEERLRRIRPTRAELRALGDAYIERLQPGAHELVRDLHAQDVYVAIVSGGIRAALLPMAAALGIPAERVHAVSLRAAGTGRDVAPGPDRDDDIVDAFDGPQLLATQTGKITVVERLLATQATRPLVVLGDGATDAAVRAVADAFVAYTGVVARPAVLAQADHVVTSFGEFGAWLRDGSAARSA